MALLLDRARRSGAEAIEFALLLPALVLLMFSITELAWYFHRQLVLVDVVEDAARRAATMPREEGLSVVDVAEEEISVRLVDAGYAGPVSLAAYVEGVNGQQHLHLGVSLPHEAFTGVPIAPHTVAYTTSMRLEDPPVPSEEP